MLTCIADPYLDHWCYSGTNAKGKWGIFPAAFIDMATLKELQASDRASIASSEKHRGLKMLSQLSIRKASGRNSMSDSGSSRDPMSPRPSVY